jgi:hypothetical protein
MEAVRRDMRAEIGKRLDGKPYEWERHGLTWGDFTISD